MPRSKQESGKRKKRVHFRKEAPFPIPLVCESADVASQSWFYYTGCISGSTVVVRHSGDMDFLYKMGFFGKGTLSRSQPNFQERKQKVSLKVPTARPEGNGQSITSVQTPVMNKRTYLAHCRYKALAEGRTSDFNDVIFYEEQQQCLVDSSDEEDEDEDEDDSEDDDDGYFDPGGIHDFGGDRNGIELCDFSSVSDISILPKFQLSALLAQVSVLSNEQIATFIKVPQDISDLRDKYKEMRRSEVALMKQMYSRQLPKKKFKDGEVINLDEEEHLSKPMGNNSESAVVILDSDDEDDPGEKVGNGDCGPVRSSISSRKEEASAMNEGDDDGGHHAEKTLPVEKKSTVASWDSDDEGDAAFWTNVNEKSNDNKEISQKVQDQKAICSTTLADSKSEEGAKNSKTDNIQNKKESDKALEDKGAGIGAVTESLEMDDKRTGEKTDADAPGEGDDATGPSNSMEGVGAVVEEKDTLSLGVEPDNCEVDNKGISEQESNPSIISKGAEAESKTLDESGDHLTPQPNSVLDGICFNSFTEDDGGKLPDIGWQNSANAEETSQDGKHIENSSQFLENLVNSSLVQPNCEIFSLNEMSNNEIENVTSSFTVDENSNGSDDVICIESKSAEPKKLHKFLSQQSVSRVSVGALPVVTKSVQFMSNITNEPTFVSASVGFRSWGSLVNFNFSGDPSHLPTAMSVFETKPIAGKPQSEVCRSQPSSVYERVYPPIRSLIPGPNSPGAVIKQRLKELPFLDTAKLLVSRRFATASHGRSNSHSGKVKFDSLPVRTSTPKIYSLQSHPRLPTLTATSSAMDGSHATGSASISAQPGTPQQMWSYLGAFLPGRFSICLRGAVISSANLGSLSSLTESILAKNADSSKKLEVFYNDLSKYLQFHDITLQKELGFLNIIVLEEDSSDIPRELVQEARQSLSYQQLSLLRKRLQYVSEKCSSSAAVSLARSALNSEDNASESLNQAGMVDLTEERKQETIVSSDVVGSDGRNAATSDIAKKDEDDLMDDGRLIRKRKVGDEDRNEESNPEKVAKVEALGKTGLDNDAHDDESTGTVPLLPGVADNTKVSPSDTSHEPDEEKSTAQLEALDHNEMSGHHTLNTLDQASSSITDSAGMLLEDGLKLKSSFPGEEVKEKDTFTPPDDKCVPTNSNVSENNISDPAANVKDMKAALSAGEDAVLLESSSQNVASSLCKKNSKVSVLNYSINPNVGSGMSEDNVMLDGGEVGLGMKGSQDAASSVVEIEDSFEGGEQIHPVIGEKGRKVDSHEEPGSSEAHHICIGSSSSEEEGEYIPQKRRLVEGLSSAAHPYSVKDDADGNIFVIANTSDEDTGDDMDEEERGLQWRKRGKWRSCLKKDPYATEEQLHLMLEEAFFLSFGLGCLRIFDPEMKLLDLTQTWQQFQVLKEQFLPHYVAYHYFRSKGWVPKSGLKFGCDYILYREGPPFYHGSYSVVVVTVKGGNLQPCLREDGFNFDLRQLSWVTLAGLNRITEHVAKELMMCYVIWPEELTTEESLSPACISKFTVKEIIVSRWVSSQERESKTADEEIP